MSYWKNVVVFFINGIGDNYIALPAFRALSQWCEGRLTVVTSRLPAARIFDELPARIVRVAESGRLIDWQAAVAAIDKCDLFVSLVPWGSDTLAMLAKGLKPELSIGYVSHGQRSRPFDIGLTLDHTKHSAFHAFDVVRLLWPEARFEQFAYAPPTTARANAVVASVRERMPEGMKWLAVHTQTVPGKMWRTDRFSRVLSLFLKAHPEYVCFLMDTADFGIQCEDADDRIVETFSKVVNPANIRRGTSCLELSIAQCFVLQSQLFLGIDSCFLHVADLGRVPSVSIFGPTSAVEFGSLLAPHRTLQGRGSTDDIDVDEVLAALDELAGQTADRQSTRETAHVPLTA